MCSGTYRSLSQAKRPFGAVFCALSMDENRARCECVATGGHPAPGFGLVFGQYLPALAQCLARNLGPGQRGAAVSGCSAMGAFLAPLCWHPVLHPALVALSLPIGCFFGVTADHGSGFLAAMPPWCWPICWRGYWRCTLVRWLHKPQPQRIWIVWLAVLVSALLSVGLALVQWLDVRGLNIFVLDMPAGGRPLLPIWVSPIAPRTLCFLGCASLLYLHERGVVRGGTLWLAWCWLSFGMALSQSRTGWLQIACLVVVLCWLGPRMALRLLPRQAVAMGAVFIVWVVSLPWLADTLLITAGRTLGDQMQGGVRFPYWLSMLEAVLRRPWLGYGWLQTGLAQQLDSI